MNLKLDKTAYEEIYLALNDIKDAIDDRALGKASALVDVLITEVRYAKVQ